MSLHRSKKNIGLMVAYQFLCWHEFCVKELTFMLEKYGATVWVQEQYWERFDDCLHPTPMVLPLYVKRRARFFHSYTKTVVFDLNE